MFSWLLYQYCLWWYSIGSSLYAQWKAFVYKDEIVCTSNLKDYDTPWSFLGRNNSNRPCALAAAFLLLKERNREDDTKNVIKRVINEGKIYWEDPLIYFTKVFDRFGVRFNPLDSTFQKTSLMKDYKI